MPTIKPGKTTPLILRLVLLFSLLAVPSPAYTDSLAASSMGNENVRSMTGGIQEAVDALPPEGGTVFVPSGLYVLKASVSLRSNVTLTGSGFSTILRHVDETKSSLAEDAAAGQNQVVATDATGFEVGMDVIIKDDDFNAGWEPNLRTITAIDGNTISLNIDLDLPVQKDVNGVVVNAFPVIKADGYHNGTTYTNVLIENIKVEGNKANVGKYSWQQAGIAFVRAVQSTIRNVWVDESNHEGISDQGLGVTGNTISNNLITNGAGKGIHLGTINRYFTVSGNTVLNNLSDGIFFCNVIQYGYLVNNTISDNKGHGIGGINHSGYDGDNYNVIEGNIITRNFMHGIEATETEFNTILNNIISDNSQGSPGIHSGIYLHDVNGFLVCGNEIIENHGGGISCTESELDIVNNLIVSNEAGGLALTNSTSTLTNNTIADNITQGNGGGIFCDESSLTITDCILWGNTPDQIYLAYGDSPTISYSDIQDGYTGTGNIETNPLFMSGLMGDFYLMQTTCGQLGNSPCLNIGSDLAENICFTVDQETTCLDLLTTSSCHISEAGQVDMGFHYDAGKYSTLTADLVCLPTTGTLPFNVSFDCTLTNNYPDFHRQTKAVINISTAVGGTVTNWRSGTVNLGPGEMYNTVFSFTLPAFYSLVGENISQLVLTDVTPPPYNQPPYPPCGAGSTDSCTVVGRSP